MLQGKVVLGGLSVEFGKATEKLGDLTEEARGLEERHAALLDEEREVLEELARTYLPELSPEAVSGALAELRDRLRMALEEQERRRGQLEEQAAPAEERVRERERVVAELEAREESLAARVSAAKERVERILAADGEHRARAGEHHEVMARRELLARRRSRLVALASAERPRYEADPAFRYLLGRDWGEPGYRGGFLTRRLDRWLADRIDFETLARNHRILKVGARQVQAEIRELGERAAALERDLDEREEEVSRSEGLLTHLEGHAGLQRRLVAARKELTAARAARDALLEELRETEAMRGRHYREAVALHRDHLETKTVRELEDLARTTSGGEDDALVDRLEGVRRRLAGAERELKDKLHELERHGGRASRLAELDRIGSERFASRRIHFPDDFQVHPVLRAFMNGEAEVADVVRELEGAETRQPLLGGSVGAWLEPFFTELGSIYDHELPAEATVLETDGDTSSEVLIHDADGRVVARRVTRRELGRNRERE